MVYDERGIPLKHRFQEAVITKISPTMIFVAIKDCSWAKSARIPPAHFTKGTSSTDYAVGQQCSVFLRHRHGDSSDEFYASFCWANKDNNPWFQSPPVIGTCHEVVVEHIPNPERAYAVSVESAIDMRINRSEVIGATTNIADAIEPDDHLLVEIISVHEATLSVEASMRKAKEREQNKETIRRRQASSTNLITVQSRAEWKQLYPWPGADQIFVAICLNDTYFAEHLLRWLDSAGFEAIRLDTPQQLSNALASKDRPSHVILSKEAWPDKPKEAAKLKALTSQNGVSVVWLNEVACHTKKKNTLQEEAAFNLFSLLNCLINPVESSDSFKAQRSYHTLSEYDDNTPKSRLQTIADNLLRNACTKHHLHAAVWVRRTNVQQYDLRALYHIDFDQLQTALPYLHQSELNNVLESCKPTTISLSQAGSLKHLAPTGADQIYLAPMNDPMAAETSPCDQAVAFFYSDEQQCRLMESITPYLLAMQALTEAYHLAQSYESLLPFAVIGKNRGAHLHEIRQSVFGLKNKINQLAEQTEAGHSPSITDWRLLNKQAQHLDEITDSEINQIRKQQPSRVSIRNSIERTIELVQHQFNQIDCSLSVIVPDLPLNISHSRIIFEQSLRNILDNALYFVEKNKVGRKVVVRAYMDQSRPYEKLYVDITDNGPGVATTALANIFKPRESTKGTDGTGLGLHYFRSQMHELGGDISLARNIRWHEVSFRISIPINLSGY